MLINENKQKMLISIVKSLTTLTTQPNNQSTCKPDIAVLVCLLKAMGFHLEKFEKEEGGNAEEIEQSNIKISLQCGSSKMQAVLKMNDVTCQCPGPEEQNGSFWSVTGSDNVNKIEETGSTLLPYVSKEKNLLIQCICHNLFEMIEEKNSFDANISTSSFCGSSMNSVKKDKTDELIRSYTQPEINMKGRPSLPANYKPSDLTSNIKILLPISPVNSSSNSSESDSLRQKLSIRQDTFDLGMEIESIEEEPRSFIPNRTKSPEGLVSNLCGSLDQFSLRSSDDSILQYVLTTLQNLEKVVEKHIKRPISSSQLSLHGDEIFQKPSMIFGESFITNSSKSTVSRTGSTTSLQSLSRSSTTLQRSNIRKSIGVPSRVGLTSEKTTSSFKTPMQTRKPLITPSKVSAIKTSAEKLKKQTTVNDRTVLTPKRRISETAVSGSSIRTPSTGVKSTTTKGQSLKTPTSRFGFKK